MLPTLWRRRDRQDVTWAGQTISNSMSEIGHSLCQRRHQNAPRTSSGQWPSQSGIASLIGSTLTALPSLSLFVHGGYPEPSPELSAAQAWHVGHPG